MVFDGEEELLVEQISELIN